MSRDRFKKLKEILIHVLDLPENERDGYLDQVCAGDAALREEVEAKLALVGRDPGVMKTRGVQDLVSGDAVAGLLEELDPAPAEQIGPYRIKGILGEGGMGLVYHAEQLEPIRREVALKVIKLGMDTKEVIARFESERQALALMDHPNIARVHDAGSTEEGRPYFVMEYVEGIPITDFCDRHRLSTRQRLELFSQVCLAIHHAHQKGIIHRDIKPSNVLVSDHNGTATPKVIDFGVAKATSQRLTEKTMFTEQGQLIGTPEYMSPEQAEISGAHVDITTDVYSLGVLLYELLTGVLPFESEALRAAGFDEIRRIMREDEPPKPSTRISALGNRATDIANNRRSSVSVLSRAIRGELDWIIMLAMEKERSRRYQSASELALDIERHLRDEPVVAGPPSTAYRLRKLVKRHKRVVGSLAAVIVALTVGLGLSTTMFFRAESARAEAESEAQKAAQINTFLQEMLASVNPAEQGRDVTVREVLDEAAKTVEAELAGQPEIRAAVHDTIGTTYTALGLYTDADSHLRTALATRQGSLGQSHADVATSLFNLANLLLQRGEYEESEQLFKDALAMRRELFGEEHPDIAACLHGLAAAQSSLGRYDEAKLLLRSSLAMQGKLLGEEHPDVAGGLNTLANILYIQGEYAEAETLLRQALVIHRKHLGEEHPEVGQAMNSLATLLQLQGKYSEAESLFREALAMRRELLGEEHPEVAASFGNLGLILRLQGKFGEAERYYRKALAIQRKQHDGDHPDTAANLHNLATVLKIQERYAEAEPLSREAVAMVTRCFGEEHPNTATCLASLAGLLGYQGKHAEAESLYKNALAMRRKVLGEEHASVALNLDDLANLLQNQGRYAEAESYSRRSLLMQEKLLGEQHPDVARSLHRLATIHMQRGESDSAEPLLRRCLEIRKEVLPTDHALTAWAQNLLGRVLVTQEKYTEAEALLLQSNSTISSSPDTSLRDKRKAIDTVIDLYRSWGKPAQAAEWREKRSQIPDM